MSKFLIVLRFMFHFGHFFGSFWIWLAFIYIWFQFFFLNFSHDVVISDFLFIIAGSSQRFIWNHATFISIAEYFTLHVFLIYIKSHICNINNDFHALFADLWYVNVTSYSLLYLHYVNALCIVHYYSLIFTYIPVQKWNIRSTSVSILHVILLCMKSYICNINNYFHAIFASL